MSGQTPSEPLTLMLARRLAAPTTAADRARAAACALDWAGCAIAGAVSPAARAVSAALADEAEGQCTALAPGEAGAAARRVGPLAAALMNGALGNVLEMDDVDKRAVLHPGPVVVPAALAAAEAAGAGAAAFLDAIVRGYEAVIRLGRAVGPGHYAFWHNTGTCGPLGAAAAAGSILKLAPERAAHALALAATQASGFWQTRHEPGSMAKQLHTARAAHAGLHAARLAAAGFDGPLTVLEGRQGFFAATCPGADPYAVMDGAEAGWRLHEVSVKPWPACRHAHAAIDAALAVRERAGGIDPGQVERIEVLTYADAIAFCDAPRPQSVIEAKFSLQHAVADALRFGPPDLSRFEPAVFDSPEARALAARVHVAAGPPFDAAYPARYGARVAVALAGGVVVEAEAPDALGDPENPLSDDALDAKADALARRGGRSAGAARALIAAARGLPQAERIEAFANALAGRASAAEQAA